MPLPLPRASNWICVLAATTLAPHGDTQSRGRPPVSLSLWTALLLAMIDSAIDADNQGVLQQQLERKKKRCRNPRYLPRWAERFAGEMNGMRYYGYYGEPQ